MSFAKKLLEAAGAVGCGVFVMSVGMGVIAGAAWAVLLISGGR